MNYLVDVNILLAAIWTSHADHVIISPWLTGKRIVLCPISEIGFLRISTNKRALGVEMEKAKKALSKFSSDMKTGWIPCDLHSHNSHPRSAEEVTDHYLADLAAKHGLKLATLDAHLKHAAVELVR